MIFIKTGKEKSGIKCNALDYILKPVGIDELVKAVNKVELKSNNNERIDSLLDDMRHDSSPNKIALADDGGYALVDIKSIIRCEASINYTIYY